MQSKLNSIDDLSFFVKNDIGYDLVSLYNETNLKYNSLNYLLSKNKSIYVTSNTANKKLIQQGLRELGTTKGTSVKTKTKKSTRSKQKAGKKARQVKQRVQQMSNPLALRNLLNDVISEAVAMKMKAPALQFRTGRFANSVEVTDVLVGPRGGTQIEYTYQRNPYETFEPGGRMGSTHS